MPDIAEQIRAWTDEAAAGDDDRVTVEEVLARCDHGALDVGHRRARRSHRRAPRLVVAGAAVLVAAGLVAIVVSRSADESIDVVSDQTTASTAPRLVAPEHDTFDTSVGTARLRCHGSGSVPVVMVSNHADPDTFWHPLIDATGQEVLLCTFHLDVDAELGPGRVDDRDADALAASLDRSGLPSPFVLVAEGDAWTTVLRFGDEHPDLVGGALLLDPAPDATSPDGAATRWPPSAPVVALTSSPDLETQTAQRAMVAGLGAELEVIDADAPLVAATRPAPVYLAVDRLVAGVHRS